GAVVYAPVFRAGFMAKEATAEARREHLRGFVFAVFEFKPALASVAAAAAAHGLLVEVVDVTSGGPPRRLGATAQLGGPRGAPVAVRERAFYGRVLRLEARATAGYWQPGRSRTARAFAGLVQAGALFLSLFVLTVAGRTVAIGREVAARTADLADQVRRRRASEAAVRESEARLRQLNGSLEQLVQERTTELRASEQRLHHALAATDDGVWDWDIAAGTVYFSPQWCRLLGYAPAEVPGRVESFLTLVHPDDMPELERMLAEHLAGRVPVKETEARLRVKSGEWRWFLDRGKVVARDAQGAPTRMVGTIADISERKRAEAALSHSVALLRATLESTADGILTIGADGKIQSFNERFVAMWGLPADVIAARDDDAALRFVVGQLAEPERFLEKVRHLYAHPHEESYDTLEFRDGRTFERYSRPMVVGGAPAGRVWSFRDVSARRRDERALHDAHERASVLALLGHELAEAATPRAAALAILAAAQRLIGWDSGWLQLWSEEREAFENAVNIDLIDGERREVPSNPASLREPSHSVRRAMDEGAFLHLRESETDDLADSQPYGNGRRSLSRMLAPVRRDGRLLAVISIQSYRRRAYDEPALDLMRALADHCAGALARLQASAALRESEQRFRGVFDASPIPILLTAAPDGRLIEANAAALEAFGYTRAQVVGRTTADLATWVRPELRAEFFHRIATEKQVRNFEAVLRTDAGEERVMLCSGTRLEFTGGTAILTSGVDITDVRRVEAERALMQERLLQNQKTEALGTLAGGVAHDFNNLLAGILNYTELARADVPATHPHLRGFLGEVLGCGQRARELVRQILLFSRAEDAERAPLRLTDAVNEALRLVRSTAPAGVEIVDDLEPGAPLVLANATQVHQVVTNLCINAHQAIGAAGGRITVSVRARMVDGALAAALPDLRPGRHVCLAVADTGPGIEPAVLARIFDPFFTTKKPGEGTGIGLAVVRSIARSHRGAIRALSQPGAGTIFEWFLPVHALSAAANERAAREVPRGRGQHLLVVDDQAAVALSLRAMLERLDYRVTVCTDPRDALAKFSAAPAAIDALITDLQMPGLSGLDLARQLLAQRPELPVFISSGFAGNLTAEKMKEAGITDFLPKPVELADLADALARALR
ncbi:MAG: hypothetical protein RLZZ15_1011, partial [Verrucomicrobiota bacterium]